MDNQPEYQEGRRQRPKQYIPDPAEQQRYQQQPGPQTAYQPASYQETSYEQPAYQGTYPQQQYAQPQYAQPQYAQPEYPPQYQQYAEPEPEPQKGDNVAAIVMSVLFAIAAVAGVVLFFLWRGAAAEADKPPVTVTQTQTVTTTETTTKRPSIFGSHDDSTPSTHPGEPLPQPTAGRGEPNDDFQLEVPSELRGIFDDLRDGAESAVRGE